MPTLDRGRAAALTCLLLVAGCSEPAPTSPGAAPSALDGTWRGQLVDGVRGAGAFQMSVAGRDPVAVGSFLIDFAGSMLRFTGDATADTRDRPAIDLFLRAPGAPGCATGQGLVVHAQLLLDGNLMTGTYDDLVPCGPPGGGSIRLERR
jgi:hypothetical protein